MDFFLIIVQANAKQSIQHITNFQRFRNLFPQPHSTGTYSSSRQAGLNTSHVEKASFCPLFNSLTNQTLSQKHFYTLKLC